MRTRSSTGSRGSGSRREDGGARSGSALALLFAGREPVAALARGGLEAGAGADWDAIELGGLRMTVEEPLRAWRVTMDGERPRLRPALRGARAARRDRRRRAGRAGRRHGRLRAAVRRDRHGARPTGARTEVRCLGQRGHGWGEPDWSRIEPARTVARVAGRGLRPGAGERAPARQPTTPTSSCGRRCSTSEGTPARRGPAAVDDLRRRGPPAPRRPRAVARRTTSTRTAGRARSCAARRSTSASCGSTARSSAGGSTARAAWAATTCCAAPPTADQFSEPSRSQQ